MVHTSIQFKVPVKPIKKVPFPDSHNSEFVIVGWAWDECLSLNMCYDINKSILRTRRHEHVNSEH